jgi:hypothetical protein
VRLKKELLGLGGTKGKSVGTWWRLKKNLLGLGGTKGKSVGTWWGLKKNLLGLGGTHFKLCFWKVFFLHMLVISTSVRPCTSGVCVPIRNLQKQEVTSLAIVIRWGGPVFVRKSCFIFVYFPYFRHFRKMATGHS